MPNPLLYWRTIRHLSPSQSTWRLRRLVRRLQWRLSGKSISTSGSSTLRDGPAFWPGLGELDKQGPWKGEARQCSRLAEQLSKGRFSFLSRQVTFSESIDWTFNREGRLWRFHLHYFDYLQALLVHYQLTGDQEAFGTFRRLTSSWISSNQRLHGDGWHPFTVSLRIVNWMMALEGFRTLLKTSPGVGHQFLEILHAQGRFLRRDLEWDVRGNHLIKNLKALICGGLRFQGAEAEQWLEQGLKSLAKELREQVSSDGGHFERCPGYHLEVWKDCLELAHWLRNADRPQPWLDETVGKMADFFSRILPQGGRVPLLKDTAWDAVPRWQDLFAASSVYLGRPDLKVSSHFGLYPFSLLGSRGWQRYRDWKVVEKDRFSAPLRASGFYVVRDDARGDHLILDAGPPSPSYLSAHAHADMLSYELMLGGEPVIVDSGVYRYEAGRWRDYFRSTPAHNTVAVGNRDQSEVWASFRMGRRAKPTAVYWRQDAEVVLLQAGHDGYRHLPSKASHRRTLLHHRGFGWWLIVDEAQGRGRALVESFLHFHPDVGVETDGNRRWTIGLKACRLNLSSFGEDVREDIVAGRESPLQGWYSERFGKRSPNQVLTLSRNGLLPAWMGYAISRAPLQFELRSDSSQRLLSLTDGANAARLIIPRQDPPRLE